MLATIPSSEKRTYRIQFRFWLDVLRDEEHDLAIYAEELKKTRSFIQTIRDALRLIRDLRKGRVEVLEQLFPFIKQHYAKPALLASLEDDRLARIEQLLLEQKSTVGLLPAPQTPRKSLVLPALEEAFEIKQATSSADDKPTWNFMISSALSVYGHCNFLPPEIKAYGVRTGRLAAEKVKPPESGNAKKMVVPQLEAPSFGDEDLQLL